MADIGNYSEMKSWMHRKRLSIWKQQEDILLLPLSNIDFSANIPVCHSTASGEATDGLAVHSTYQDVTQPELRIWPEEELPSEWNFRLITELCTLLRYYIYYEFFVNVF